MLKPGPGLAKSRRAMLSMPTVGNMSLTFVNEFRSPRMDCPASRAQLGSLLATLGYRSFDPPRNTGQLLPIFLNLQQYWLPFLHAKKIRILPFLHKAHSIVR